MEWKRRLRALARTGTLCLAALAGSMEAVLACPAGGGTCPPASSAPASQPLGAALNVGAGNPINVMSGNKYQREEDMPALPGVLGLEIVRHYNSIDSGAGAVPGVLGRGWKLSYETRLVVGRGGMQLLQADGSVANFSRDVLRPSLAVSANPANGTISVQRGRGGDEYLWRWTDGRELSFDQQGKLVQIKAASGEILSLLYDAQGMLVKVTDPQGRSLRLAYLDRAAARRGDRFRGVQGIDSPVGRFSYEYGSEAPMAATVDRRTLLANLVRVRHPADSQVREYHYEDVLHPTLLTGVSVAGQRYSTFAYNAAGKGVLSTHANGAGKVTLDYERPGVTVVTNSEQRKTTYRYALQEDDYRLNEVRGAGCAQCGPVNMRYGYDRAGHLVESTELDAQGAPLQTARTEVDSLGRPMRVSRTLLDGRSSPPRLVARYEYAARNTALPTLIARPSVVPGREATLQVAYNQFGQPLSVTERGWTPAVGDMPAAPLERSTHYRYRTIGGRSLLAEIDGPLPNGKTGTPADSDITRFEYDAGGISLLRTVAPGNMVTEVRQRDAALRPLLTVSSDGVRLTSVEEQLAPSGQVLQRSEAAWLLDSQGRPDAATVQRNTLAYRYDGHGRVQAELTPGHSMTQFRYDAAGNLTHLVGADLSQTVRSFDSEGRMTAERRYGPHGGDGFAWQYKEAEDVAGASFDAQAGRILQQWPDALQPLQASYLLGQVDSVAAGEVAEVVRPDGSQVRRWFDDFGRVVATRSPERGLQLAGYDAAGALVTLRDARGVTATIVRDAQGRALEVGYADAQGRMQQRLVFRYAGVALAEELRLEQGRADSRAEWRSDAWGRAAGKRLTVYDADGKAGVSMQVASVVDRERQVLLKTLPSGAVVGYHYDPAGNVVRVTLGDTPLLDQVRYAMTAGGLRPVAFSYGNGLRSATRHGADGMPLSHLSGPDLMTLRRDPHSGETWFDRKPAPTATSADAGGRWTRPLAALLGSAHAAALPDAIGADVQGWSRRVAYDAHGRLVSEARGEARPLAVAYGPLGDRLGLAKAQTDADGHVLAHGALRLAYGAAGELQQVSDARGAIVAAYRYDAQGQRIAKQAGGQLRYFLYDDGQLQAEADATGRIVAEYIYLGRRPVARLRYDAPAGRSWLPGSQTGPVVEYLHTDQRDAVETVTDAGGKLLWRGELDAFGALRSERGAAGTMPLRLSGQYADRETGLYYNVHRYYDPAAGRYLQADPLGLAAGLNLYAYAANDPLNKTDPLGLSVEPDNGWGGIVAPWLFGTLVHSQFANQVRLFGPGWGANDTRGGTWDKLRPDAYFVQPGQPAGSYTGTLWELKPTTWSSGPAYTAGKGEVALYVKQAKNGCWTPGSSSGLVGKLRPDEVLMNGEFWEINYVADKQDNSGLLFYNKTKLQKKPQPNTVPAPVLSKKEADELAQQMQQIRAQGAKENWSTLQTIGMVVLIGLAIAALIAVAILAAPAIAAVIAAIGAAITAASAGTVALMAALAAVFAFSPAVAAEAQTKGDEKQKGMLDGAIGWFKSWF
jgi:RHS repeat-associated protein